MTIQSLSKVLNNSIFGYVSSRYLTYGLQFINSILIAAYLGPYFLGIWGFFNLLIQYCAKIDFGITHSVNTIISIEKEKTKYISLVIGNGIFGLIILSLLITAILLLNTWMDIGLGDKYNLNQYYPFLLVIAVATYFNSLLAGVFRVFGKLMEIAFQQSVLPLIILIVLLIFKNGENLLDALIWANSLSVLCALILYIYRLPIKINFKINSIIFKKIFKKGLFLFLYNSSFYFIVISTRTFVSNYYSISEFGYFTFAFSMANAFFLLLQAFNFLIWPKLINRFANFNNDSAINLIKKIKNTYVILSYLLAFIGIISFPFFLNLFPEYQGTKEIFSLILLTIIIQTNSFGYQGLMIAKGNEKSIGLLAFYILILNISLNFLFIKIFHFSFTKVILATLISYIIYVFFLVKIGRKTLELHTNFISIINDGFPYKLTIPFILFIIIILFQLNSYFLTPILLLFVLLNYFEIKTISQLSQKILQEVDIINKF